MVLEDWLKVNNLRGEISQEYLLLGDQKYRILELSDEDSVTDPDFFDYLRASDRIDNDKLIVFEFGSYWYWSPTDDLQFNPLRHIGSAEGSIDLPYLGIRGKYDMCNGSRDYTDWCKKAKFLGISTLGICESDTLAGTLSFQIACQRAGIKSILGETVTVQSGDDRYKLKLYCKNEIGWKNLLNINAQIKVFNDGFVSEEYVLNKAGGLICVIDCSTKLSKKFISLYSKAFGGDLYYGFDTVEWSSPTKENEHLSLLREYIRTTEYFASLKPILLNDSYYLDRLDSHIRKTLNTVGKIGFQNQSENQWFKTFSEVIEECDELFKDEISSTDFIDVAVGHTTALAEKCNFLIPLGELHLPQYELTEEESKHFESSKDLFWDLIQRGLEEKVLGKVEDEQMYFDRIEREVAVIEKGGFIDYFLITWDILSWCKRNGILTGLGRGSAAGCLVSYLLNIVQVDPLIYDLLFERFLSEARLKTSLPDTDSDVSSSGRDATKRYIEERYGMDFVTSIGTYGTFKIKAAIKDLGKAKGADFAKTNYLTSVIAEDAGFVDVFKSSKGNASLEGFIQQYPSVIEDFQLIEGQPRTVSIHAAGIIIVPKTYKGESMTIYDWMPVKKMDGVLVTEWEGPQLEAAGYLKADILGISQLEKFEKIIALIKENRGIEISYKDMNLSDESVYALFQEGYNEDVFQLGAPGLKNYCSELKPQNINDIIATLALYRPGPMESGSHKKYVKIKHGEAEPEYDYMLEDVTKATYGLYIYQEQVMKAVHILGGLTLVEAEDVRKAMGKKDHEKMKKYEVMFVEGAIKNGCNELEAVKIWNKLSMFASYGFNKSHSAAYGITGYFSQWLKVNFPIEFWSIALQFSDQKEISRRIAEMHTVSNIKVLPPDINHSEEGFKPDFEKEVIYWSISSIKQVGEKTLENLMNERKANGQFFSFEEFFTRIKGKGVNKTAIRHFILAGCFDQLEKINHVSERYQILQKACDLSGDDIPEDFQDRQLISKDYFWILKQKEITGFGYFDFRAIFRANSHLVKSYQYLSPESLLDPSMVGKKGCVVGILSECIERTVKSTGDKFAPITIASNDDMISCIIWAQIWPEHREKIKKGIGKLVLITGEIKGPNPHQKTNHLQTNNNSIIEVL